MLEKLQITFDPLGFVGILITALVTIYIFKADIPFSYLQERHEKLIFPLFDCLEPVLYQPQDSAHLHQALSIIEKNKSFADGKLLNIYHNCFIDSSQNNFLELCAYADQAYDYSCRKLKLKRRSIEYRVNRKQYRNKKKLLLYIFCWSLPSIIAFVVFVCIGLILFSFLAQFYETASNLEQLIMLCFFSLFLWKFHEKL